MITRVFAAAGAALLMIAAVLLGSPAAQGAPAAPAASAAGGSSSCTVSGGERVCTSFTPASPAATAATAAAMRSGSSGSGAHTDAIGTDPSPGSIPDYCSVAGGTRFGQCSSGTARAASYNTSTGAITGTVTLQVIFYGTLSNTSRGWNFEAKAYIQDTTGKLISGTRMSMFPVCTDQCQAVTDTSTAAVVKGQYLTNKVGVSSPVVGDTEISSSSQSLRMTFTNPGVSGIAPITTPSLGEVRCDQGITLGGAALPGCVYTAVIPTFVLSGSAAPSSPQHAAFVSSAQQSLPDHWGQPGSGNPLHRFAGTEAQIKANRARSCMGFVSNGGDDSCDEYPYASTQENLAYGGTSRVATGHVPGDDNSAGGTKLSTFNLNNRVLDKDAYYVQVTS